MLNPCDDCDRLQETRFLKGNASIRPSFNQPTMYDHLTSFSKFKEHKNLTQQLSSKHAEQLWKCNRKFTNLDIEVKKTDQYFDKFSKQDISKYCCELKDGRFAKKSDEIDDLWQAPDTESKTAIILRTPVICPVSKCARTIGVTSVLSHFLRDHNEEELKVECINLYAGGRSILLFDRNMFPFGENVCLGVLAYGGIEKKLDSQPALRGICKQNSFLSKPYTHLEHHLPVLLMICRTSMSAVLDDKSLAKTLMDPKDVKKHVLVIWLATVQTTKPIYSTITAFDKSMSSSRSTIINVRSLDSPQNPIDFMSKDTNYLMLNHGELNILSDGGKESIRLEIRIQEFHK